MTNVEKHQYLKNNVLAKLIDALDALENGNAVRNGLNNPETMKAVRAAIAQASGQTDKYTTTV